MVKTAECLESSPAENSTSEAQTGYELAEWTWHQEHKDSWKALLEHRALRPAIALPLPLPCCDDTKELVQEGNRTAEVAGWQHGLGWLPTQLLVH